MVRQNSCLSTNFPNSLDCGLLQEEDGGMDNEHDQPSVEVVEQNSLVAALLEEFQAFVAASAVMPAEHHTHLEQHAFDPQSPQRSIALEALGTVNPAAKKIAESEQKQRISALKETESGQMYGCCSGYEF